MIKIEKVVTPSAEQMAAIIRGVRNPLNSWAKSDSIFYKNANYADVGVLDRKLMHKLAKAGTDHRKFMRMWTVYADVTAPLYWWKEYDTYKVGTVANSCSTMHKIASEPITLNDFSIDDFNFDDDYNEISLEDMFIQVVGDCEELRKKYVETKDKKYWRGLIQLLPSSYNQKRTVMLNYEVLANMYNSRKTHKLDEWRAFCTFIEQLPYSELITLKNA